MRSIEKYFTAFVVNVLKVLLGILLLGTIGFMCYLMTKIDFSIIIVIGFYALTTFAIFKIIKKKNFNLKYKVTSITLIGLILRLLWMININTMPYSDFNTIYVSARELLCGNNEIFKGVGYFARFPHLTAMIIYICIYMKIFKNVLIALKIGNLILAVISMIIIYKISKEIFKKEELSLTTLGIASMFGPMVSYVGVLATENVAIPFYLLSIYFFVLYSKNSNKLVYSLLAGFSLGVGNLFRMVGPIMLIAYILYIILYIRIKFKDKMLSMVLIITTFLLVLFSASYTLKVKGITEVDLWKGREPGITNILKGTNIDSYGMFNEEDSRIIEKYNYDFGKIEEVAKETIKYRLTNTPPLKLMVFYVGKFIGQWVQGDMSGTFWSETGTEEITFKMGGNAELIFQLLYVGIIGLTLLSLFNKERIKRENSIINLFYIILCGYGAFYLISEMQGRYSYIVCWLFPILAVSGLEKVIEYNKSKTIESIKM